MTTLVAATWLGHGRRMEGFLVFVSAFYSLTLILQPNATEHSQATGDIFWAGYAVFFTLFAILKTILSGSGLIFNISGYSYSRELRFSGALIGFILWSWLVIKFIFVGAIATPGCVFSFSAAVYGEIGVLFMSAANLPVPGAPGNKGLVRE